MEQQEERLILILLALLYQRACIERWMENAHGDTLRLDEEQASMLFPLILSGVFVDDILEDVLGLSPTLCEHVRTQFMN